MDLFNSNFFRFAFGFLVIVGTSILVIGGIALFVGPSHGIGDCLLCAKD